MIKKTWLAAALALGMFSAPASASVLQDCFQVLSNAQIEVWKTISLGTLNQCKLNEAYAAYKINGEQFWTMSEANYNRVASEIERMNGKLNQALISKNCPYGYVSLDTWGFGEGFEYEGMCSEGFEQETAQ